MLPCLDSKLSQRLGTNFTFPQRTTLFSRLPYLKLRHRAVLQRFVNIVSFCYSIIASRVQSGTSLYSAAETAAEDGHCHPILKHFRVEHTSISDVATSNCGPQSSRALEQQEGTYRGWCCPRRSTSLPCTAPLVKTPRPGRAALTSVLPTSKHLALGCPLSHVNTISPPPPRIH